MNQLITVVVILLQVRPSWNMFYMKWYGTENVCLNSGHKVALQHQDVLVMFI